MTKHVPATWRKEIADAMRDEQDPGPILACTMDDAGLDKPWRADWAPSVLGYPEVWTAKRVYVGVNSIYGDYILSVLRNPPEGTAKQ